jgi:hypothetical protein
VPAGLAVACRRRCGGALTRRIGHVRLVGNGRPREQDKSGKLSGDLSDLGRNRSLDCPAARERQSGGGHEVGRLW